MKFIPLLFLPFVLLGLTRGFTGGGIIHPENILMQEIEEAVVENLNLNRTKRR